jgi:predicted N-acetyltransferase YhbS
MHIDYLARHLHHLSTLAAWHHAQWGYLHPGETVMDRSARLRRQAQTDAMPLAVVALQGGQPLGSASLVQHDMDTHPEWSPWLASVYVASPYRRQGIGTALVERIVGEARRMDVERMYLFTPDRASFYRQLGWKTLAREEYHGDFVTIMEKAFTALSVR